MLVLAVAPAPKTELAQLNGRKTAGDKGQFWAFGGSTIVLVCVLISVSIRKKYDSCLPYLVVRTVYYSRMSRITHTHTQVVPKAKKKNDQVHSPREELPQSRRGLAVLAPCSFLEPLFFFFFLAALRPRPVIRWISAVQRFSLTARIAHSQAVKRKKEEKNHHQNALLCMKQVDHMEQWKREHRVYGVQVQSLDTRLWAQNTV